ncbi:MAG TPA: phosphatidylglycerophosphatase A [Tepidisphaeraceae bacterium]|nr:phosphatidylglycerophosphatase A [Tepidisphaeraceae bacterium]
MKRWIATFGGAGMSPIAPGTVGSLAASVVLLLIYRTHDPWRYSSWQICLSEGIVLAGLATVWLGPWAFQYYGRKDPGSFVLDEVAGICLTTLFLPMYPGQRECLVLLVSFLAFRLFDVWKPWPCHRLEQLPDGWGILTDDLCAAVYANLLCQLILRVLF